jgi:hypothetical protein
MELLLLVRQRSGAGQKRLLRDHDAISMAYDRSLIRIGEEGYHNKFAETKETSQFCVTLSRSAACRCRTWIVRSRCRRRTP